MSSFDEMSDLEDTQIDSKSDIDDMSDYIVDLQPTKILIHSQLWLFLLFNLGIFAIARAKQEVILWLS